MREIQLKDKTYQINKLNPFKQFNLLRRLTAFLPSINSEGFDVAAFSKVLSELPDEQSNKIILDLLEGVKIDNGQGLGFSNLVRDGVLMFDNLDLLDILKLAFEAAKENFLELWAAAPETLKAKIAQLQA